LSAIAAPILVLTAVAASGGELETTARADDSAGVRADTNAPAEVVKFHASEVTTSDGAHAVFRRINNAAWRVCLDMFPPTNGPGALSNLNCRRTLVEDAVKQADSPKLTAVYESKTGEALVPG
jgi:UrcA family protein